MTTRRTPLGQGPARRSASGGRTGSETRAGAKPAGRRGGDAARSATRPPVARRTVAGGGAQRTAAPEPRRRSGRVTILIAVLIALALAYTYPIRVYLDQQSDISRMEAAQAAQRRQIDELSRQAALWKDPEYIKSKARERFYMGYPGETLLVVLWDPEGAARESGTPPENATPPPPEPWHETLWSSIRAANDERAGP
jgi:cell division protein FtsB